MFTHSYDLNSELLELQTRLQQSSKISYTTR